MLSGYFLMKCVYAPQHCGAVSEVSPTWWESGIRDEVSRFIADAAAFAGSFYGSTVTGR